MDLAHPYELYPTSDDECGFQTYASQPSFYQHPHDPTCETDGLGSVAMLPTQRSAMWDIRDTFHQTPVSLFTAPSAVPTSPPPTEGGYPHVGVSFMGLYLGQPQVSRPVVFALGLQV